MVKFLHYKFYQTLFVKKIFGRRFSQILLIFYFLTLMALALSSVRLRKEYATPNGVEDQKMAQNL